MALNKIKYKGFTFPYNPATTSFRCDRSIAQFKYPGVVGNELEDFSINAIIISGSGCFYGSDAYTNFHKLYEIFRENGVGTVYHPIFKHITRGLMVSLDADVVAEDNVIEYSFEIIADTEPNITEDLGKFAVPVPVTPSTSTTTTAATTNSYNVGDIVYFKGGRHYVSSYGGTNYAARAGNARITIKAEGRPYPYHLIKTDNVSNVYGWVSADTIGAKTSSSASSGGRSVVHTVKSGENLSTICARYSKQYGVSISYKTVASQNGIKNANLIYPGQKITIKY